MSLVEILDQWVIKSTYVLLLSWLMVGDGMPGAAFERLSRLLLDDIHGNDDMRTPVFH